MTLQVFLNIFYYPLSAYSSLYKLINASRLFLKNLHIDAEYPVANEGSGN